MPLPHQSRLITSHDNRQFVRVSVQGYNDEADLRALIEALDSVF